MKPLLPPPPPPPTTTTTTTSKQRRQQQRQQNQQPRLPPPSNEQQQHSHGIAVVLGPVHPVAAGGAPYRLRGCYGFSIRCRGLEDLRAPSPAVKHDEAAAAFIKKSHVFANARVTCLHALRVLAGDALDFLAGSWLSCDLPRFLPKAERRIRRERWKNGPRSYR